MSSRRRRRAASSRRRACASPPPAYAPADPVSPNRLENLAGGLLLGLVAGLGATLLRRPRRERGTGRGRAARARAGARAGAGAGPAAGAAARRPRRARPRSPRSRARSPSGCGRGTTGPGSRRSSCSSPTAPPTGARSRGFETPSGEAEWDTATEADGVYWVCAARARPGRAGGGDRAAPARGQERAGALAIIGRVTTSVVTGGAGFLGSHLCDALLERGHRVICVDNLLTELARQHRAHPRRPVRVRQPRRDRADRDRRAGRLRLPLRRAREPDRLPAPAAALAQGRLVRHAPRARAREVQARALPARLDERGLRRPAGAPAARVATGATSTRSARAASTTRRSATPRR